MSGAEQMYMLASAGINPNDSNIEFDSTDEKRYWKQAKKESKGKLGKHWEPEACLGFQALRKVTPVIIGTSNDILYPIKLTQLQELKGARRFSEVILFVMVDGEEVIARCLLDTECT